MTLQALRVRNRLRPPRCIFVRHIFCREPFQFFIPPLQEEHQTGCHYNAHRREADIEDIRHDISWSI